MWNPVNNSNHPLCNAGHAFSSNICDLSFNKERKHFINELRTAWSKLTVHDISLHRDRIHFTQFNIEKCCIHTFLMRVWRILALWASVVRKCSSEVSRQAAGVWSQCAEITQIKTVFNLRVYSSELLQFNYQELTPNTVNNETNVWIKEKVKFLQSLLLISHMFHIDYTGALYINISPFIVWRYRVHDGCDRSTGDAHTSWAPDSMFGMYRVSCLPILNFVFFTQDL